MGPGVCVPHAGRVRGGQRGAAGARVDAAAYGPKRSLRRTIFPFSSMQDLAISWQRGQRGYAKMLDSLHRGKRPRAALGTSHGKVCEICALV